MRIDFAPLFWIGAILILTFCFDVEWYWSIGVVLLANLEAHIEWS